MKALIALLAGLIAAPLAAQPVDPAPVDWAVVRAEPAIWRIRDKDTTIYLLGTLHALPPGLAWQDARIARLVEMADALLLESTDSGGGLRALFAGLPESVIEHGLPTLAERTPESHRAALGALMASLDPRRAAALDQVPTWIAATRILVLREAAAGARRGPGVEAWLTAQFRAAGKPVSGIEDPVDLIAGINALPQSEQQAMLVAALDRPDRTIAELDAPVLAWARGDTGPGSPLALDFDAGFGSAALREPMLARRNRAWAASLETALERQPGTILFAAGASHFVGDDSVLAALAARGISAKRVK